jgi:dTDP-4-amino-4,6-dideoxygalactose transaminase
MGGNEQKYIQDFDSNWLSMGLNLTIFEENLENYLGSGMRWF